MIIRRVLTGLIAGVSRVLRTPADSKLVSELRRVASHHGLVTLSVGCSAFMGCVAVASVRHEPVPQVSDEFSYLLMSNTFASGHLASAAPPFPEFFDTFQVLVRPVYASKYLPAQGFFLAIGEVLTGHPVVGVWLSTALACAATCWMLQAWIGSVGAVVGGFLMVMHLGVLSYWSQTYWGGMVPALGGALFLGAARQ